MTILLTVERLEAFYGNAQALFDISFSVSEGEVVALLGRNGMGKTTTVRSIMGLHKNQRGSIAFEGIKLSGLPPYKIAQKGLGLVPEGKIIFPTLTVRENLIATAVRRERHSLWTLDTVFRLFPRLQERQSNMGTQLSGGEQQMLAIGRALLTNPKLLILDEATEGLAPLMRSEIWRVLRKLKYEGQSIIVIDKNIDALAELADQHVVIEKGAVVWSGTSEMLKSDMRVKNDFLHV